MGMIDKMLLLYVCIAIACAFWQPSIVFGPEMNGQSALGIFNLGYNATTNQPTMPVCSGNDCYGHELTAQRGDATMLDSMFQQLKGATGGFIDALNNVIDIFKILFKVVFSPFIIFTSPQMTGVPTAAFYFIAVPAALLLLIAFINWVRSGVT